MKYYIILLLAITLISCKKEDNTPKSLEQTIFKMQGVRMYKGTYIASYADRQGNITIDTQWLDNYPVEIYQLYKNTIALRSLDSTGPSFSCTDSLLSWPDTACNECVHFGLTKLEYYHGRSFDVTYNPATDKITRVYVSYDWATPGEPTMKGQVFELAEQ